MTRPDASRMRHRALAIWHAKPTVIVGLYVLLLLAGSASAQTATAKPHKKAQHAHEHGCAKLNIAIDGKEATRRIRAAPRFACLPVIAVTAHASKRETEEILAAGVTSVVTKPVEHSRLIQAIRSGLRGGPSHA